MSHYVRKFGGRAFGRIAKVSNHDRTLGWMRLKPDPDYVVAMMKLGWLLGESASQVVDLQFIWAGPNLSPPSTGQMASRSLVCYLRFRSPRALGEPRTLDPRRRINPCLQ